MYKKKSNVKARRKLAKNIHNKYMKPDAPMELNLPSKFDKVGIGKTIDDNSKALPKDFFNALAKNCEQDMMDIFDRLRKRDKKVQEFVQNYQKAVASRKQATATGATANKLAE